MLLKSLVTLSLAALSCAAAVTTTTKTTTTTTTNTAPSSSPTGFGAKAKGGAGAPKGSVYTVKNYVEFKSALNNGGKPDGKKVIYIDGTIDGNYLADGTLATEAFYAAGTGYTFQNYLDSFNQTLLNILGNSTDPADAARLELLLSQEDARYQSSLVQQKQVALLVGANTSIVGKRGAPVRLIKNVALAINHTDNVVLRDFKMESPYDWFPEWQPTDGSGAWNSKYDTVGVVTSTNIWIDHLTMDDGDYPDSKEPTVFGKVIQRHDGMIDITEGSDSLTVSFCYIHDHDKSHLVGNNDLNNLGPGDVGKLRVTFYGNYWKNSLQRNPRTRFGQNHVFNNLYEGVDNGTAKIIYYLGMGINSSILSEANDFNIAASSKKDLTTYIVGQYKGYVLEDNGSTFNGTAVDVEAIAKAKYDTAKAAEVTAAAAAGRAVAEWATHEYSNEAFVPPYKYVLLPASKVRAWVLKNVGEKNPYLEKSNAE